MEKQYLNFSNGVSYPIPEADGLFCGSHDILVSYLGDILRESFPIMERPWLMATGELMEGQEVSEIPPSAFQWAWTLAADAANYDKLVTEFATMDTKKVRRQIEDLLRKAPVALEKVFVLLSQEGLI